MSFFFNVFPDKGGEDWYIQVHPEKNLMSLYNEIMCMEEDLTQIFAELGTDGVHHIRLEGKENHQSEPHCLAFSGQGRLRLGQCPLV